jgi:hypothetical protein
MCEEEEEACESDVGVFVRVILDFRPVRAESAIRASAEQSSHYML